MTEKKQISMTHEDVQILKGAMKRQKMIAGGLWVFGIGFSAWWIFGEAGAALGFAIFTIVLAAIATIFFRKQNQRMEEDVSYHHKEQLQTTILKKEKDKSGNDTDYKIDADGFGPIKIGRLKWNELEVGQKIIIDIAPKSKYLLSVIRKEDGFKIK